MAGNTQSQASREAQFELEKWSRQTGAERILRGKWEAGAAGFLGQRFANLYLKAALMHAHKAKESAGRHSHIWKLLDCDKAVAQVALETLFFVLNEVNEDATRNRLAAVVGRRAEFVLWLNSPIWKGSSLLKGLRLAGGNDLSMGLIQKRLTDKGFRKAQGYRPLTTVERVALGTLFIEILAQVTGLVQINVQSVGRKRRAHVVTRTQVYWDFLKRWKHNIEVFRPLHMPMLVEPRPWTGLTDGGYLSILTQCSSVEWERWNHFTRYAHDCVLGSLNYLQSVPFTFNHAQIALQRAIWALGHEIGGLPTRDRLDAPVDHEYRDKGLGPSAYWRAQWRYKADRRKDGARTKYIHAQVAYDRLAGHERLFWVWFMDYRGRKYPRGSQLNYSGGELFRTQLQFERKSPIKTHEEEFAWAVGDAIGLKKEHKERFHWLMANRSLLKRIGERPMDCLDLWSTRKEPWRFVALAREWAAYEDDPGHMTGLPFQLDQSCSGYGHMACLTRDRTLARLTNVIGSEHADLYESVLRLTGVKLGARAQDSEDPDERRRLWWWMERDIPRSLVKEVVMPCIYRRSHLTMMERIGTFLRDEFHDFLVEDMRVVELARTLASVIHESVCELLPQVASLHRWLATVAKAQIMHGLRPHWVTPNGLVVESYRTETEEESYFLQLSGRRVQVKIRDATGQPPSRRKSMSQLSADFIHSQDAAFLERFIWHWSNYRYPMVSVHDCVATSLDKVALMRRELNDQYARFYSEDYLQRVRRGLKESCGIEVEEPPCVGDLDPAEIGENPYLFT
ncbi:MAG: DNA-directed RNA polymerase [Synechococcus sp.]